MPQIGSLVIDFDSFMVVFLSLYLLNLNFNGPVIPCVALTGDTGAPEDAEKAESEAHACAMGLNRPQEKEEPGNGAPLQGTPRA